MPHTPGLNGFVMKAVNQRIKYVRARDGCQLAWADSGSGPALVKAANWMTHLEYEWESPVWRHWMQFFARHFRYIRHDERGCGMTDRTVGDLSVESWTDDLETVIDAAKPAEPFGLLGISQGGAASIAYAVRHPEKVSRLILYGSYARGPARRGDADGEKMYRAMIDLVRLGWGSDNPTFRQVFTSRFVPGASDEQLNWFNDLCARTTTGEIAAELLEARAQIDIVGLLSQVKVPTLVIHSRGDAVVPIAEGRLIAGSITSAEFVELDSQNHVLLEHEPAWQRFCDEVLRFFGMTAPERDPAFDELTARESQILELISEGLGNAEIAEQLLVSEKTVRNHITNLFDKLGVWSRAQAIVFARDRGFKGR